MTKRTRPAGVEDPVSLSEVPHGAPLLRDGQLLAAGRDASWWDRPDVHKEKYVHVMVASHRLGMRHGFMTAEAAACDPTRIMLDDLVVDAATVSAGARCRRAACAALFAQADEQAASQRQVA